RSCNLEEAATPDSGCPRPLFADCSPDRVSQSVCLFFNLNLVLAFDHDASQILSPGISDQQPASSLHLVLHPLALSLDFRKRIKRRFASNAGVEEQLWVASHLSGKLPQRKS